MTEKDDNELVAINISSVPRWLRKEAMIKARREGRPLAEILREMLREWLEKSPPKKDDK